MFPKLYTEFIDGLSMLVKSERIPMSRIDDAVRRILWVKFMMGIFENPFADYSMTKYLGIQVNYFCFPQALPFTSPSSQIHIGITL